MRTITAAAGLLALFSGAAAAEAQQIRGRLLDDETLRPVADAQVALMDGRRAGRTVITDADGRFIIAAQRPGTYRLRASHLAYRTADSPDLVLLAGDTLEVEMRIHLTALVLTPLTVTAATRAPLRRRMIDEFYDRQRRGMGRFIGPADVLARDPFHATDLLLSQPGIRIDRPPGAGGPVISMRGTFGWCQPTVVLDGFRARLDRDFTLDQIVSGSDVRAVEIYRRFGDVPAQFAAGGHFGCGAVVIWTTRTLGDAPPARSRR